MEIETNITLNRGSYRVQILLPQCGDAPISGCEMDAIRKFGEPRVDMGGSFDDGVVSFNLPSNPILIPSQLPYSQCFTGWQYGIQANAAAVLYRNTILERISLAMGELSQKEAGETGRQIVNVLPVIDPQPTSSSPLLADWMGI